MFINTPLWRHLLLFSLFIACLTGCAGIHHHQDGNVVEVPTISVAGLVTRPGIIPIPSGGLSLRDAVLFAGGNSPEKPLQVLVSVERREGVFSFSLPLVLHDLGGGIQLRAGDKLTVQKWYETDLSRTILLKSDEWVNNDDEISEVLNDQGKRITAYPVTISDLGKTKTVQYQVIEDEITDITWLPNLGKIRADRETQETVSVISLKRFYKGKSHEFILIQSIPRYLNSADPIGPEEIFDAIAVLPRDSVSIMGLRQHPLILSSMIAPILGNRSPQKLQDDCLPRVHDGLQKSHATLNRITLPIHKACDQVQGIIAPPLQSLGERLAAPLR